MDSGRLAISEIGVTPLDYSWGDFACIVRSFLAPTVAIITLHPLGVASASVLGEADFRQNQVSRNGSSVRSEQPLKLQSGPRLHARSEDLLSEDQLSFFQGPSRYGGRWGERNISGLCSACYGNAGVNKETKGIGRGVEWGREVHKNQLL